MDEASFTDTQASLTDSLSDDIRQKFDIDWSLMQYRDLSKPLYSAIAARLKIAKYYRRGNIPQSVADQARYWASSYTVNSWTNAVDVYTQASAAVDTSKLYSFSFRNLSRLSCTIITIIVVVVCVSSSFLFRCCMYGVVRTFFDGEIFYAIFGKYFVFLNISKGHATS